MAENTKTKVIQKSASKTKEGLTLKQDEFCEHFVGKDKDLFGNATQCYLEVYGLKDSKTGKSITYMSAQAAASRMLSNVMVIDRVNALLETGGFSDENVDKQHSFLINQFSDFKTKMVAIKEYNAVKSRVVQKVETVNQSVNININLDAKTLKQVKELTEKLKKQI